MRLLLTLALLLCAVEAGASTSVNVPPMPDGKCHKLEMVWSPINGSCDHWEGQQPMEHLKDKDGNPVTSLTLTDVQYFVNPEGCLATMEAAMRAIEPWIAWNPASDIYINERFRKLERPVKPSKLWTAAKQCWRNK